MPGFRFDSNNLKGIKDAEKAALTMHAASAESSGVGQFKAVVNQLGAAEGDKKYKISREIEVQANKAIMKLIIDTCKYLGEKSPEMIHVVPGAEHAGKAYREATDKEQKEKQIIYRYCYLYECLRKINSVPDLAEFETLIKELNGASVGPKQHDKYLPLMAAVMPNALDDDKIKAGLVIANSVSDKTKTEIVNAKETTGQWFEVITADNKNFVIPEKKSDINAEEHFYNEIDASLPDAPP